MAAPPRPGDGPEYHANLAFWKEGVRALGATEEQILLATATPRPWERGRGGRLTIWADGRCIFEDALGHARLADADLIVRAVNEYGDGVSLLRRARTLLAAGEDVAGPDWFDQAAELVDEIDALAGCEQPLKGEKEARS